MSARESAGRAASRRAATKRRTPSEDPGVADRDATTAPVLRPPSEAAVPSSRAGTVGSVDNALLLLHAFRDRASLSVTEGAALLGVAASTSHRLLTTLQSHGFVSQDPVSRRYWAGPSLIDVALGALRGLDVRKVAHRHLESLSEELGETTNLVVLDKQQLKVRFLDSVEGPHPIRVSSRTGTVLPAHCTAVGKVLLSQLGAEELLRRYPDEVLPGVTEGSITSRTRLLAEVARARATGYATNFGESTVGLTAVAVAVSDPRGQLIAAIGVSAPQRLPELDIETVVAATRRTVHRIEAELHSSGSDDDRPSQVEAPLSCASPP